MPTRIETLATRLLSGNAISARDIATDPSFDGPGVYVWFEGDSPIYVGRAGKGNGPDQVKIRTRLTRHFGGGKLQANWRGRGVKTWAVKTKRCKADAVRDWMRANLTIRALIVPNDPGKMPWRTRALLEHYLIAHLEPEANLIASAEH